VPGYMNGNGGASNIVPGQLVGPIGSITMSFADVATIVAMVNWQAGARSGASTQSRIQMRVDGNIFLDTSNSCLAAYTSAFGATGKTTVAAGAHTFTFYVGNDWTAGAWDLAQWSVLLLGVMR
jgi:hypothetical protein